MQHRMARSKKPSPAAFRGHYVPTISRATALSRLRRLLEEVPELRSQRKVGPFSSTWKQNVEGVLDAYFGPESLQLSQFSDIQLYPSISFVGQADSEIVKYFLQGVEAAERYLRSRISELEEDEANGAIADKGRSDVTETNATKVFVVHGHDHGIKETVARFLSQLGLDPVILHERPDQGRTIIEKIEHNADVSCAVVILSPDDIASPKSSPNLKEERARQNVIFEFGFFVGRLGRDKTFALVRQGVAKPSDIDGLLYIPMDDNSWKMSLVRELKAAHMKIDSNKVF